MREFTILQPNPREDAVQVFNSDTKQFIAEFEVIAHAIGYCAVQGFPDTRVHIVSEHFDIIVKPR